MGKNRVMRMALNTPRYAVIETLRCDKARLGKDIYKSHLEIRSETGTNGGCNRVIRALYLFFIKVKWEHML